MSDDVQMTRCVVRGFIGTKMVTERIVIVRSRRIACEYVVAYFANEVSWSGCDRHTVDMDWV